MESLWQQWLANSSGTQPMLWRLVQQSWVILDVGLVFLLTYTILVVVSERRTLWMVQGLVFLIVAAAIGNALNLSLLHFVLDKIAIISAVAMAVTLQSEFRQLLEQLGRGDLSGLFQSSRDSLPKSDSIVDEVVDAVKELSQNRTGAIIVMETRQPIDERDFSVPGVKLNAEVSKELLQTIFQTSTLLHDGAVLIRSSRIISAGAILPLSERKASRQLGTRHRAAMGITERVKNCVCVVVSEETGSISLAERGTLNRPLTSSKLKELLEAYFSTKGDGEVVAPNWRNLTRQLSHKGGSAISRFFRVTPSTPKDKQ
ncbi:MAG: TIGR00159 family protein [Phormidium sp. GEM2.Bin31]|nr:diadenylate cyclase CdaA [Phormidium sp. BM_Day4_Bin.17]TVR11863.1 MAG: TIGR00159 family protein [Phormidium sp. GEM2.Bin31]UCJ10824.1 MAG: diadenylate cyclase CdaA [Phormidium sp. PBR-2020]